MNSRIHVMHLLPNLEIGGMENGVVNLVNHIDCGKFRISICCLNHSGPMIDRVLPGRAKVLEINQKPGKAYSLPFRLSRLFRQEKVDVVHTHNYYTGIYGIPGARFAGAVAIHGQHGFDYDPVRQVIARKTKERLLCVLADHITCVSPSLKDVLCVQMGIRPHKVSVIVNGVDFERFTNSGFRRHLRQRLEIDDDCVVIGSVGRLHYQKNYELLIRAFAQVNKISRSVLLLVGEGQERSKLEALAANLNIAENVLMVGEKNNIPEYLAVMDIFVLPSLLEGMSNTILEAMCAGLPVIASNIGGNPELVYNGESGLLFQSDSLDALTERIERLLYDSSLREKMGENAMKIAGERFSIQAMVSRYEALYQVCANTKRAGDGTKATTHDILVNGGE